MTIRFGIPRSKNQWILLLLGLFAGGGSALPLARGLLSLSWPSVDGVITQSRDRAGYRVRGVDIGYRYTVDGREYDGNRYRFQFMLDARRMRGRDVQSTVGRYRVGEPVRISVNPSDPTDSVLVPGPDPNALIPFVLGIVLTVLALGQVVDAGARPVRARPRYVLAKILAAAGVALVLLGAFYLYQGMHSTSWPSVEGRIVYSHARSGRHPEALLWYEYYVGNQRYVASNYRNGGNVSPFRSVVEAAAKRYPAGRTVPVYYNPGNPQDALLEPGVWWGNFVAPAFGLLLLGAAWIAKKYADIMASRPARSPRLV